MTTSDANDESVETTMERPIPRYLTFLPTHNGGVRRDLVQSFEIETIDGSFKGGATAAWIIRMVVDGVSEPINLRPVFLDSELLIEFIDNVFPGASFDLLPPEGLRPEGAEVQEEPGVRRLGVAHGIAVAGQIRDIGRGFGAGDAYEPFKGIRGGRPPLNPVIG